MAMTPSARLSSAAKVEVSARISHDGQPIARAGDLEGSAGTVDVNRRKPVTLVIDKVHP
jgi:cytochrome c-type biogenesis protein CcmH